MLVHRNVTTMSFLREGLTSPEIIHYIVDHFYGRCSDILHSSFLYPIKEL